jgi:HEAT repeat protein
MVGRLGILLLPAALLSVGTLRPGVPPKSQLLLLVGTAFQVLLCFISYRSRQGWRQAMGPSLLLLYLTGLGWLGLGLGISDLNDWYLYFAQAVLLIVSLIVFAMQILVDSGAPERRRAQLLAKRLADRKDWPADLANCRALAEVKALREALHLDATPALQLLGHPRPQVRIAALAALEFRKYWRSGQPQMVFQLAQQSPEPIIRAAAMSALANVDDRVLVEQLADYLQDPSPEVRRAAQEALLWDMERRWSWIRHAIRRSLADSAHAEDGPLLPGGQSLTAEAVKDLTAWAAEKGILAVRAAHNLGLHYGSILNEQPDPELREELQQQLADPHAPAPLRIELAHLLHQNHFLDRELQEKLIDPINPAPLRLIAAEALLEFGDHAGAIAALRDVARLPNREIALATASVVQRLLGVDLGLPLDQPLPPLQSRLAAEVTRRVMSWAEQSDQPAEVNGSDSLSRPEWIHPASSHAGGQD